MNRLRKGILAVTLVLAFTLPALGCQPNPTVPPVVGKGNLEDKIRDKTPEPSGTGARTAGAGADTTAPTASAAQQRVQKSLSGGKLTVNVDAAVELPATGKLPVVKVQPRKFTQAEADNIIKVLFQGKQAYKPKEILTKDELNRLIILYKAKKSQMKPDDKALTKVNSAIDYFEQQLKTAPDKVDPVPSDGQFKVDDLGGQEINVTTPMGKTNDANLDVYSSKTGRSCSVWFTNEDEGGSYLGTESKLAGTPRGMTTTLDAARALAVKTVRDLGSDLKLAGISMGACRGMGISSTGRQDPDAPQAYIFSFTREVGGVPTTYESDSGGNVPQEDIDRADANKGDYIEPHPYERIVMAIDDSGILELQWSSPDMVLDTVSSDAETISFDEAMKIFEKQFFIHNALVNKSDVKPIDVKGEAVTPPDTAKYLRDAGIFSVDSIGYGEDIERCTFTIDRIVLGLSRVAVKDKQDEFLIVPVWDFFGNVKVEYTKESGYAGFTTENAYKSFLTVNAIDGSIINRSYGY